MLQLLYKITQTSKYPWEALTRPTSTGTLNYISVVITITISALVIAVSFVVRYSIFIRTLHFILFGPSDTLPWKMEGAWTVFLKPVWLSEYFVRINKWKFHQCHSQRLSPHVFRKFVLGPLVLPITYVIDIPEIIPVPTAMYADDGTIWSTNSHVYSG